MQAIRCQFGVKASEKRYEVHNIFVPDDKDNPLFPEWYFSYADVKKYIWELQKGHWIQTIDGYIVPIIRVSPIDIRIPGISNMFRKRQIAHQKADVYFDQPDNYWQGRPNNTGGGCFSNQQRIFCWVMAQTWNMVKAIEDAGYSIGAYRGKGHVPKCEAKAKELLAKKKVQEGIRMALREHMKALNMGEETLVLNKKDKLMKDLGELQDAMKSTFIEKINNGESMMPEDMTQYLQLVEALSGELNTVGDWLGYGKEGEKTLTEEGFEESLSMKLIETKVTRKLSENKLLEHSEKLKEIPQAEVIEGEQLTPAQLLTQGAQYDTGTKDHHATDRPSADTTTPETAKPIIGPQYSGNSAYPLQPTQ